MVSTLGYGQQQNCQLKNTPTLLAISITVRMRRYDAECIAQWSTCWALGRIALAAATVDDFGVKHKTLQRNISLASYFMVTLSMKTSTHVIVIPSCVNVWHTTIKEKELSYISSCQTLRETNNLLQSSNKNWLIYKPWAVKLLNSLTPKSFPVGTKIIARKAFC